jgi:hypothetical protein
MLNLSHDSSEKAGAVTFPAPAIGAGGTYLRGFFARAVVSMQVRDAAAAARELARQIKDHSRVKA